MSQWNIFATQESACVVFSEGRRDYGGVWKLYLYGAYIIVKEFDSYHTMQKNKFYFVIDII